MPPGTWPRLLEEKEVRELLDGLFELRIAAEAWRTDLFPELSPARTVHRAACMAEGFRIEGIRGGADSLGAVGPDRADLRRADRRRG